MLQVDDTHFKFTPVDREEFRRLRNILLRYTSARAQRRVLLDTLELLAGPRASTEHLSRLNGLAVVDAEVRHEG